MILLALPGLVPLLIYVVIFVMVVALIWYLVKTFFPPELQKYGTAVIVVLVVIFLIYFLLSLAGSWTLRLN